MRAHRLRLSLLLLLGAGLGLVGCDARVGDRVVPVGCDVVRAGPRGPLCGLDPTRGPRELTLLLRVPAAARVRVVYGGSLVPGSEVMLATGERRLRVQVRRGVGGLWLLVSRAGGLWRLPLAAVREAPWLAAARADWYNEQHQQAIATLTRHLSGSSPEEQAIAKGYLGRIYLEKGQVPEARAALRESLDGLRAVGLVSAELMNAFFLASLYREHDRDLQAAAQVLDARRSLLDTQPELASWFFFHAAQDREVKGDLRGALRKTEEGLLSAQRFDDTMAQANLGSLRLRLQRALGREDAALEKDLEQLKRKLPSPCWQAYLDADWGYSRLLAREAALQGAAPPGGPGPRALLERALATTEKSCQQDGLRMSLLAHLARVDLVEGKTAQAAERLKVLRTRPKDPPGTFKGLALELLALEGDLALQRLTAEPGAAARPQWITSARAAFEALSREAPEVDENESRWRAALGLALVAVAEGQTARARGHFEAAEEYLDRRAAAMPLGAGRGSFLGRHERGTRHYLALLHREEDHAGALRLIRRARVRGLLPLAGLSAVGRLPAAEAGDFRGKLRGYESERARLEDASQALAFAPIDKRQDLAVRQRVVHLDTLRAMDDAVRALPPVPPPQDPPPAGEALLTCHPLPQGDQLCLFQDAAGVAAQEVGQLPAERSAAELTRALLLPFAGRLERLRRLRVLPFGALRAIDVHALGLPPSLDVVYALDVPRLPGEEEAAAFEEPRTAGLFADPTDQLGPKMVPVLQQSEAALQAQGFQTELLFSSGVDRGEWPGQRQASTGRNPWLRLLSQPWQLLAYLAHTEDLAPWRGRIGRGEGLELWVSDVLLAQPPGPILSYFVTCFGAEDREDTGGAEALTPGTALLLRSRAQVLIAPSRAIPPEVGFEVLLALSRRDPRAVLATPGAELRAALAAARASLASRGSVVELDRQLAAFRVYVR